MKYLLIMVLIAWGCASVKDKKKVPLAGLTEEQMEQRSKLVSQVKYFLQLDLVSDPKVYHGVSTIEFNLKKADDLFVDFFGGKVEQVVANGKSVKYDYDNHHITIDEDHLQKGKNKVVITYSHAYSTNAEGFYRFEDPSDGKSYVYTDFEPYKANELFPSFDQPNLKAHYNLTVRAPKDWVIITYDYPKRVVKGDDHNNWIFPESALFSTYILEVAGGPYRSWEDRYTDLNGRVVPMKLYARASLAKYVDEENWFSITKKGMKFFEDFFDYPYPFNKYDQILVPDFNWGGMENVAAVTYNEDRYIFKSKPTDNQRLRRANVILHELAHMWFGDLVTMNWWNGLWLNESFATVMANIALAEATDFEGVWQSFFSGTKGWAYWTDQLVTTHPIEVEVSDTNNAFTNFDGFTYGKGASALKQLRHLLGDKFKEGIQLYFKRHAYKNTELSDFFQAMEDASGMKLDSWVEQWLEEAGLNSVTAKFTCNEGKITRFTLKQDAPEDHSTLRTHRTKVGLFHSESGVMKAYHTLDVTYEGKNTEVSELVGVACPELVYPNVGDYDYVKVLLDEKSLNTVKEKVGSIQDEFTRQMLWTSLWDMVQDAKFSAISFYNLALDNLEQENNYKIKTYLIDILYRKLPFYVFHSQENYLKYEDDLANLAWKNLNKAKAGSDYQKEWFNAFVPKANDNEHLRHLANLLTGSKSIPGLSLDQDMRWKIVINLNRREYKNANLLLKQEVAKDKSSAAEKEQVAATVIQPSLAIKQDWFQQIIARNEDKSLAILGEAMHHMFPIEQRSFKKKFASDFYQVLPELVTYKQAHFLETFSESMVPTTCDPESVRQLRDYIDEQEENLPVSVVKSLRIANQENQRCVEITSLMNQSNPLNLNK